VALVSNVGFKPMTAADRRHIAEHLYGTREWTMQRIADALDIDKATVSRDLANCCTTQQLKPAKSASNPKGAGRPKAKPRRSKFGENVESTAASLVLDKGLTKKQASKAAGVSEIVVRTSVAREEGRREAWNDPPIDPATLSASARQKFDAAIRQHQRKLDAELADFRAQLVTEFDRFKVDWLRTMNAKQAEYDAVISARKGVMTRKTFDAIRRCLHPDSRQSVSDDRLAEAFRLFGRLELKLLPESDFPTRRFRPLNPADLLEAKIRADEARRAKVNGTKEVMRR
jgi:transposase